MIQPIMLKNSRKNSKTSGASSMENYVIELIKNNISVIEKDIEGKIYGEIKEKIKDEFGQNQINFKLLSSKLNLLSHRFSSTSGNLKVDIKKLKEEIDLKKNNKTIDITIKKGRKITELGTQHKQFENLLKYIKAGVNVYLVGSAGSGKTTAAKILQKL